MEVARHFPHVPISGMGGIETGANAAQFILLGASTVQICTGAMLCGYEVIGWPTRAREPLKGKND